MSADPSAGSGKPPWFTARRTGLILLGLLFLSYPKLWLGLNTFFYFDYGVLGYPFISHAHQTLWEGSLPLWNPLSNCGAPFLAQWGTMLLYPFALIFLIFPLPWSLTYFCFAHILLGGIGCYYLARSWTRQPLAASFAAVVYVFNGAAISSMVWPNYLVALGWMPWIVLTAERAWERGGRWPIVAALLTACQLLVGTPEFVLLTWMVIGALVLKALLRSTQSRAQILARLTIVVVLAAGLIAAQFLPFVDLLLHSQRDSNFQSSKWPMPGWGWASFLVPLFHCFETPQGPFFQHGQEFLSTYYLGIGPFILAVWTAWAVRQGRVWILSGLTLLSLILALGDAGVLFVWIKKIFPVTSVARYPIKFVLLSAFAVPLLCAEALAHLQTSQRPQLRSLAVFSALAALWVVVILWFAHAYPFPYDQWNVTLANGLARLFFLATFTGLVIALVRTKDEIHRRNVALMLMGLVYLDVSIQTSRQNPSLPVSVMEPKFWQAQHAEVAAPALGYGRAFITPAAEERLLHSTVADLGQDFIGKRLALWSNLNLLDGIPKINGSSTLQVREQSQVHKLIYQAGTNPPPTGLLRFLGATIASSPSNAVEWVSVEGALPLVTSPTELRFANGEETLRALADPLFDPAKVVYLPRGLEQVVSTNSFSSAKVISASYSNQKIDLSLESEGSALVVIAQSYYPAWRAQVDGSQTVIWRANHAFQAVKVPAGRHRLTLSYHDPKLIWGGIISMATLIACGIGLRFKPTLPGPQRH